MSIGESGERQQALDSDGTRAFPCTLLQERLWEQNSNDGPEGLNVAMRWLVNGRLSHTAAEGALQSIAQRHEILRTCFREIEGRPVQIISPASPLTLSEIDLSALPADKGTERAEEIAKAEAIAPIDPRQAPLLRATLLRLGPDRGMLLITLHSMVADGWSTGLLVSEFRAAANAIDTGCAPDASEPELQFPDYALWERELLASDALDDDRAYWQRQLRDVTGTRVTPDHALTTRTGNQDHVTSILLPGSLSEAANAFARQQNVTLYSLAAAALALMLHRVTGNPRIVIASQVANREEPEAEMLFGPTVNSIMLCLPVNDDDGLRKFVRTVADTVQEALQHERLPFEIAARFAAGYGSEPLDAINLVVHRSYSGIAETEQADPGHFSLISLPSYSSGTKWDLNFYLIGRDEGWRLSCEADGNLYESGTVQGLLDGWRRCFEVLVTSPDCRLRDSGALRDAPVRADARTDENCESIPVHNPAHQVIRFHEGGANTPTIVFNNRSVYYQLARQLGESRPFIDILLYHQDGPLDLKSRTFEDFAAYALRLVRWAQPHGPYILGGHCVYGVLAFEAARQLQRMGEKVALVALFDSWAPGYRESMSRWDQMLRRQQLRLHRYGERLRRFRKGEVGLDEIVRKPVLFHLGLLPPEPGPARQSRPGEWFDDYLYDSVTCYRPTPYEGDVVLFRSNEALRGRLFDEQMGWGPLVAGNLKKVDVNSGHFDMFREQPAGQIATSLQTTLDEAKGR